MGSGKLIERLESLDVESATVAEVAKATGWIRQLRGSLDSYEGKLTRRADELHEQGESAPAEDVLARRGRASRREAAKTKRRAEALGHAPAVDEQLAKGRIGPEHADALASAAGRLDEQRRDELFAHDAELADAATTRTPEQFRRFVNHVADQLAADDGIERSERQRAAASLRFDSDAQSGMGTVRGELHPEDQQKLRRAVEGEVAALRKLPQYEGMRTDQLNAIAVVNLTTGARATQRRNRAEVALHVDLTTITSGLHEHGICEFTDGSPAPVETARRLACDAGIIPVVLGTDGQPLDVGRESRLATPEQRTALRAMYRTCAVDGCDRSFDWCEIHHLLEWDDLDGPTDLDNLLPVCSYHHHRAHEGRWHLELDPATRELTVWLPDGTLHSRCFPDLMDERRTRPAA